MKYDPEQDTFEQIEGYIRTALIRMVLFAVACFCLGYLFG